MAAPKPHRLPRLPQCPGLGPAAHKPPLASQCQGHSWLSMGQGTGLSTCQGRRSAGSTLASLAFTGQVLGQVRRNSAEPPTGVRIPGQGMVLKGSAGRGPLSPWSQDTYTPTKLLAGRDTGPKPQGNRNGPKSYSGQRQGSHDPVLPGHFKSFTQDWWTFFRAQV